MRIIVIDNCEWEPYSIADVYFRQQHLAWCISTQDKTFTDIANEIKFVKNDKDVLLNETTHRYLINLHCLHYKKEHILKQYRKVVCFQQQAGVDIYRYLLKVYENEVDKLQIIFYSPISLEINILCKPENIVLRHLEYLEIPFTWNHVITKFSNYNKPIFSNASENLLSGHGLYTHQNLLNSKVGVGNKKILFIDDQKHEWKATFQEIFHLNVIDDLKYKDRFAFRKALADGTLEKEVNSIISQYDLIFSDFYLNENHEPERWMNKENIESISGFKLFKSIRKTDSGKALPFIIHSASNKIFYYKIFEQNGVDDWIVKDSRYNAPKNEKKDNYEIFKKTIEDIINNNLYKKMTTLWEDIQIIKNNKLPKWWYNPEYKAELIIPIFRDGYDEKAQFIPVNNEKSEVSLFTKSDIVSILESAWYAIRRHINKEMDYEEINDISYDPSDSEKLLSTGICNHIGKIIEMLGVKSGCIGFSYLTNFLLHVRNSASHASDYEYFELNDAIICLNYLIFALKNYNTLEDFQKAFPDKKIISGLKKNSKIEPFPCSLIWLYLQFYSEASKEYLMCRGLIKARIIKIFKRANSNGVILEVYKKAITEKSLVKWRKLIFTIDSKCRNIDISKDTDPIKIKIPVDL